MLMSMPESISRGAGFLATCLAIGLVTLGTPVAHAEESGGLARLVDEQTPLAEGERIVFLGDSITAAGVRPRGYVTLIAEALKKNRPELGATVIGAGISGHKVPNLQKRLQRDVLNKKPTIVFIYIGINDVWHSGGGKGTSKDAYEAGLKDLLQRITAAGSIVVLATPSVIGEKTDGSNRFDTMLDEYAQISRKVAEEHGATLCDLREAFVARLSEINSNNDPKGHLTTDGVHLNPAGDLFVAEQAAAAIAKAAASRKQPAS